jgi:predicted DNA-binding transcriptional regulator AlpA
MKPDIGASDAALDRLIGYSEVMPQVGNASRWTIRRWQHSEGFPAPVSIGNRSLWSERAIQRWIAARLANPLKPAPRGRPRRPRSG